MAIKSYAHAPDPPDGGNDRGQFRFGVGGGAAGAASTIVQMAPRSLHTHRCYVRARTAGSPRKTGFTASDAFNLFAIFTGIFRFACMIIIIIAIIISVWNDSVAVLYAFHLLRRQTCRKSSEAAQEKLEPSMDR